MAIKTIERRLVFDGGATGWSRAWIINFFTRLKDGKIKDNKCLWFDFYTKRLYFARFCIENGVCRRRNGKNFV